MEIIMIALITLILILLVILLITIRKYNNHQDSQNINDALSETKIVSRNVGDLQQTLREEFSTSRKEISESSKGARQELADSLDKFSSRLSDHLNTSRNIQSEKLSEFTLRIEKLSETSESRLGKLTESISGGLDKMRESLDNKLTSIEKNNTEKLEKMREIVDHKLQETLDKQIAKSFKDVNDNLERVQKGLGEMQNMASDVGDLKKVLSNVKTKGVLGEYSLANIVEEILTKEQYAINVATRPGKRNHVEYAVKLPGKDDGNSVWLPIDSKFPTENYTKLNDAYSESDITEVSKQRKLLISSLKSFAKDIHEKYVEPPYTTDFAVMFLPVEGLYAEAMRDPELFEVLQRDYKIMVAGPSTLAALLNSLNIGFRTLAIEQRSAEVWKVLQEVKSEFDEFASVLNKAKKKIELADKEIENLISTRTNVMKRKLKLIDADESDSNQKLIE